MDRDVPSQGSNTSHRTSGGRKQNFNWEGNNYGKLMWMLLILFGVGDLADHRLLFAALAPLHGY